jgi:putative hydrolase of the HAD superfamily
MEFIFRNGFDNINVGKGMIKAIVFDFGGVLAEEGFREGLKAIGQKNGLNPDDFYAMASELVYQTGYVTGVSDEYEFWHAVRGKTGVAGSDKELRSEVLKRFILRPEMLKYVEQIRSSGLMTAILSDQTNWLDEINRNTPFFHYFDYVFNSFNLKKGKRDPSIFRDVSSEMGVRPEEVLFVDDNIENIKRAFCEGLKAIHFKDMDSLQKEIEKIIEADREST